MLETKKCNRCNLELTLENFRLKKNHGNYVRYSVCKECEKQLYENNKKNIKTLKLDNKTCSECNRTFPATRNYFRSNPSCKDGLSSKCKECLGFKFKLRLEGLIECNICHKFLPATTEYFDVQKKTRYGLGTTCKKCKSIKHDQNKNAINERIRNIRKNNPELVRSKARNYRNENKDLIAKIEKKYRTSEKGRLASQLCLEKRRTLIQNAPANYKKDDWKDCLNFFNNKCAYCGKNEKLTQDHVVPVSKGGEYTKNNIVPACNFCNISKSNNDMLSWYRKQPFYSKPYENKILEYLNYNSKLGIQQLRII